METGTHDITAGFPDRTLLIVWPSDEVQIGDWLGGRNFALMCGNFSRFILPGGYRIGKSARTTGVKGDNILAEVFWPGP